MKLETLCGSVIAQSMKATIIGERIISKVLQSGFWWPKLFKYFKLYVQECQKIGKISKQDEMLFNGIIDVEPFYCW